MPTVLIIVLLNLANPTQANLVHKTFNSQIACEKAYTHLMAQAPSAPTVSVNGFCVPLSELSSTI